MTDKNEAMAPEAGEPQGAVPQAVADELASLAADVLRVDQKASRSWKTSAVVFVILLAVIATYMQLLIYRRLKETLRPDTLVSMAEAQVDALLNSQGAPNLNSPMLADWAADKLAEQVPIFVAQTVKPQIEDLVARLPELRQKLSDDLKARLPGMLDKAVNDLETKVLPDLRQQLAEKGVEQANAFLDTIEDDLDQIISDVIAMNEQNLRDLRPDNVAALRSGMERAFEAEMGPILDEMFSGIEHGIDATKEGLQDLVAKQKGGRLTKEEQREVDLVRLIFALFKLKSETPEVPGEGLLDQFKRLSQIPVGDFSRTLSVPTGTAPRRGPTVQPSTIDQVTLLEGMVQGLQETLATQELPDEARQTVQQQLQDAMTRLEEARKAPRPQTAAPAPAAPQQVSEAETLQRMIDALQTTLKRTDLPDQGRQQVQAELDKAKKELEALQQ